MSYYDRQAVEYLDGTRIFSTAADRASEDAVAQVIQRKFRCEMRRLGDLSPVDWYAVRDGRVVAWVEVKARTTARAAYPTVFLNVRKYLALQLAAAMNGAPPFFVVRWACGSVGMIDVRTLARVDVRIGGCRGRVKSDNDVEPVIDVPIEQMRLIEAEAEPPE